jgi:GxxExxY protein
MEHQLHKKDLVHPDLSYKIIGCAFEVFNQLGSGHKEIIYHKALAVEFDS